MGVGFCVDLEGPQKMPDSSLLTQLAPSRAVIASGGETFDSSRIKLSDTLTHSPPSPK